MPQSLSKTLVHIVFSTKHRYPFIDDQIELELFSYIASICNIKNCRTIIVGGHLDHVHIFCSLHRTISQSDLVKEIKTNSSIWMKTKGQKYQDFYWQDGYGIFSVNQINSTGLIRYIKNQKAHHQNQTFKKEYRQQLKTNEIDFDERYVWD